MARTYQSLKPLIPWRQMSHPLDWSDLFGRQAPLEVEIGFGNGERLLRHARSHPEINLVGVDLSWPAARRALRKINLSQAGNVLLVLASAEAALTRLFAPHSLDSVEALFPCPWPGVRHQRRRLFSRRFLTILNNRLNDGAVFHMVTDHERFFKWVSSQIPKEGFQVKTGVRGPGLKTKYERKWCGEGQEEFHELWLTKTKHLETPPTEDIMLQAIRLNDFDRAAVENRDFHEQAFISFKELVFDPEKEKGLLQVVVSEDDFLQAFWLEFRMADDGWRLRPTLGCGLVPTKGVRRAVEIAADLAQGRVT
jgi:tRNA (guanine-N7-)-methyltransferase